MKINRFREVEQVLIGLELIHPEIVVLPKLRHALEGMSSHRDDQQRILREFFNIIKVIDDYEITFPLEKITLSKSPLELMICIQQLQLIAGEVKGSRKFRMCYNQLLDCDHKSDFLPVLFAYLDEDKKLSKPLKTILSEEILIEKIKALIQLYKEFYQAEVFDHLNSFYKHALILDSAEKLWAFLYVFSDLTIFHSIKRLHHQLKFQVDLHDAFSKGQVKSKLWAASILSQIGDQINFKKIDLLCGWYGLMARIIFDKFQDKEITIESIDIDENCKPIADCLNYDEHVKELFHCKTGDIHNFEDYGNESLVINTSCEHLKDFNLWYDKVPEGQLLLLQSNNFFKGEGHFNCVKDLKEFKKSVPMKTIYFEGELNLDMYDRFMIIGKK